jgi:bifunctional UDP-N-acetylglucosamine pyrophosphorylase/glucosamine-1-phosphate N-acetyltransferase
MDRTCSVLIAAAGKGSRAGLPYPKTLYPVAGKPIVVRIVELLSKLDRQPTIIVSPSGRKPIEDCLNDNWLSGHFVEQSEPTGMGDAVLCFRHSPAYNASNHVLLIWGDIPLIQPETVAALVFAHFEHDNDFTFVTANVRQAYTVVERDRNGKVTGVLETRETGQGNSLPGERDIGLFLFRRDPVFHLLQQDLPNRFGRTTGEHGFLYIVKHLSERGYRIEALPIATERDLISLNSISDLGEYA